MDPKNRKRLESEQENERESEESVIEDLCDEDLEDVAGGWPGGEPPPSGGG